MKLVISGGIITPPTKKIKGYPAEMNQQLSLFMKIHKFIKFFLFLNLIEDQFWYFFASFIAISSKSLLS